MGIIIASRSKSVELALGSPGKYNVVSILEPGVEVPDAIRANAKSFIALNFHDISYKKDGYVVPDDSHVRQAIDWARGKEDLVVACYMGVSRSSAIAYLIQCTREHHPRLATGVLTPVQHYPNSLIVKIGAKILEDDSIFEEYHRWLSTSEP